MTPPGATPAGARPAASAGDEDPTLAAVEALVRRAQTESVSFAVGGDDDGLADVRELLDGAGQPDTDPRGSRWRAAHADLLTFWSQVEEDLRFAAVVRTPAADSPAADSPAAATWMGWGGTTATVVGPDLAPPTHFAALREAVEPRLRRIRLLTLTLTAAVRIAALASIPGGAVAALPVALHLVRRVRGLTAAGPAS